MEQKINFKKLWWGLTAGFMMLAWIILIYFLRLPLWVLIPVFIAYLFVCSIVFYSYSLGMAGNFYYFIRKPEKAMKYYKNAIKHKTRNVTAIYNYSIEQLHLGNANEALEQLERAYKYNTKVIYDKYIPLAQSSCYWILGDIDKGISILEKLQAKYPYVNSSTLTTLGYFYLLKSDYDKAIDISNQALEDNDTYAPAWDNLGQVYYRQGKLDKAEDSFLKALEYRDTMVDSLYYMGLISEKKGAHKDAQDYFLRASKCNISSMNTVTYNDIIAKIK